MAKTPKTFRLSDAALANLARIADVSGVNETAAVEMALAALAIDLTFTPEATMTTPANAKHPVRFSDFTSDPTFRALSRMVYHARSPQWRRKNPRRAWRQHEKALSAVAFADTSDPEMIDLPSAQKALQKLLEAVAVTDEEKALVKSGLEWFENRVFGGLFEGFSASDAKAVLAMFLAYTSAQDAPESDN